MQPYKSKRLIAYVDNQLANDGLIDPVTHERSKHLSRMDSALPRYSVESVFARPCIVMPIYSGMPDAETLRQQFDHPDDVVIIQDPWSGTALCLKRDVEAINKRYKVAEAVLAEHGITKPADMHGLTAERIMELREMIKRLVA